MDSTKFCDEQFAAVADNVTVEDKSGWHKYTSKANNHKIYVQKGGTVKRIDTTLPVRGQPGTRDLKSSNGKITCHLEPDPVTFAVFVQMMTDATVEKLDGKPARPFAPKTPKAPKASATPVGETEAATKEENETAVADHKQRIAEIKARAAAARAKRKAEEAGEAPVEKPVEDGVDLSAPDVGTHGGLEAFQAETGVEIQA